VEGVTAFRRARFPLAPRSGERVASDSEPGEGRLIKSPLPPHALRAFGTLSRKRERGKKERARYFFSTRTGLPASHCLMSSTICV
jgi:hypothetical protein